MLITKARSRTGVYRTLYIDAGAMAARATNGAAVDTEERVANDVMTDQYLFDGATEEGVQFKVAMPDLWDRGSVKARVYWDAAAGASAGDKAAWGVRAGALSNDDAIDAAFGDEVEIADVVIAVGDLHVSANSAPITVGGAPALGDILIFQVARKVGSANDNMPEDAKLLGISIQYKELSREASAW